MFIWAEFLLDGLLLALCGFGLLGRSRGKVDIVFPMICAAICFVARTGIGASKDPLDYLMLPTDNISLFLFLFIAVLLINSLWFQAKEGHILWGTIAQFALYLLLRCGCFAGLEGFGLSDPFWAVLGSRLLSVLAGTDGNRRSPLAAGAAGRWRSGCPHCSLQYAACAAAIVGGILAAHF